MGEPVWDAWRPEEVARRLAGTAVPWYVAAGWAVDLFVGRPTREHGDLEIGVPAGGFGAVRSALTGYEFDVVGHGHLRWPVESPAFHHFFQTWVREPATGIYRLDVFREPHDRDLWICRHDDSIRLPYSRIISVTTAGIPYLVPEIVLLFKAKRAELPKNEADFTAVLPLLTAAQRSWLRESLTRIHPGHRWIAAL